jgi:hypothetical protein
VKTLPATFSTVPFTTLLEALVFPLRVCLAVNVWVPSERVIVVLKLLVPSAVVVHARFAPSNIESEALGLAVPATCTLGFVVLNP